MTNSATPTPFIAIITGANRGIGTAIAQALTHSPPSRPAYIYACARNPPSSFASSPIPASSDPSTKLIWQTLDISSPSSIHTLVSTIREVHPEGIDVLINNAGVNLDHEPGLSLAEKAKRTMAINVDGTLGMCVAFAPLLRRSFGAETGNESRGGNDRGKGRGRAGRIVNLSSVGGHVTRSKYGEGVIKRLVQASSIADIQSLRSDFVNAAESGSPERFGWPRNSYSASKAIVNALTRVVANDEELVGHKEKGVLVNCCCPGWVDSGMGRIMGRPPKSLEEGARIPVRLAVGDVAGVSGKFWENGDGVWGTGEGEVREWVH